jgi:voltage-gated potassium channel
MPLRQRVRNLLNDPSTPGGQRVALVIQSLIVISLISIPLETLPNLPIWMQTFLLIEEWVVVGLFTVEYVLRTWSAERPLRYTFSAWGIVDLLAILPSYLAASGDFRAIRAFRLMRLFRVLKLARFSLAAQRLAKAIRTVADELAVYGMFSLIVLYLAALGIYYFEKDVQPEKFASAFDGFWWALVTLTTVGYGDTYPLTAGGKIFTGVVVVIGLGVLAVPTGLIASALANIPDQDLNEPEADRTAGSEEKD